MIDVEQSVRHALHRAVDDVVLHPDEVDVARRLRRARHRQRARLTAVAAACVAAAVAAVATIAAVVTRPGGNEPIVEQPTPPATAAPTSIDTTSGTTPTTVTNGAGEAPSSPSAVSASTATSPTSPAAPAEPVGFRIVTIKGTSLVETTSDGRERIVSELPTNGAAQNILHRGGVGHVVVTVLGYVFVYDSESWSPPTEVGNYVNIGIIPVAGGFWAATRDHGPAESSTVAWQQRDWAGTPIGPRFAGLPNDGLTIGAIADGIALWTMHDGHILVVTTSGVRDLGVGNPIAATGTRVGWRDPSGDVIVYDAVSQISLVVGNLGPDTPAQSVNAGAFAPDGQTLAVAESDQQPPYRARGVALFRVDGGSQPNADRASTPLLSKLDAFAVQWSPDGSRLVVTGRNGVSIVDPASGTSSSLLQWDPTQQSYDAVVLPM
jgi:hypothetical protein